MSFESPELGRVMAYVRRLGEYASGQEIVVSGSYIEPQCDRLDPAGEVTAANVSLRDEILRIMSTRQYARVLLLGDYGSGKTSFAHVLGAEAYGPTVVPANAATIPFYLPLTPATTNLKASLEENLAAYAARQGVNMGATDFSAAFSTLPNLTVFLDGLDELAGRADFGRIPEFMQWLNLIPKRASTTLIVTCRTTFFPRERDYRVISPTHVFRIRPFSPAEVQQYFARRLPQLSEAEIEAISQNNSVNDICKSPIHAMLMTHHLHTRGTEVLQSLGGRSPSAEVMVLYRDFVDSSFASAFNSVDPAFGQQDEIGIWTFESIRDAIYNLSYHWYYNSIFEWSAEEFRTWIEGDQPDISRRSANAYARFLADCAFFTLIGDRYRFVHRSFLEFMVAELAANGLLKGDLSHWEVPMNSEIWEHIFHIVNAKGFPSLDFEKLLGQAGLAARGNLLLMAARHKIPLVLPGLRRLLLGSKEPTLRLVAVQGLGIFDGDPESIKVLCQAYLNEPNSIAKKLIQLTLRRWSRSKDLSPDLARLLEPILEEQIAARPGDATAIALPKSDATPIPPALVHKSYQNAIYLKNGPWNAYAIPILLLGAMQDEPMLDTIREVGSKASDPEVKEAYAWVKPFVERKARTNPSDTDKAGGA
jgi:hypothetical protein